MPIVKPIEYIKPCKTEGYCLYERVVRLGTANAEKFNHSSSGVNYVTFEEKEDQFSGPRAEFKCCSYCKQPINYSEAVRINEEIGFEVPTVKDTMARMKALRERLASNEGRTG